MTALGVHEIVTFAWIGLAVVVLVMLFFVSAPYGRHSRAGWGPTLGSRAGWILQEAPAAFVMATWLLFLGWPPGPVEIVFLAMWEAHYLNRSFVFPLRIRSERRIPITVVLMAMTFNLVNGWINGQWLGDLSGGYPLSWLADPRFIVGAAIFVAGFAINNHSAAILRSIRERGGPGAYEIPRGGMFEMVSCPNYLGELIEWTGWAIATWSLAGLSFAVWTAANLLPRALANHRWYRQKFPDYPARRKAIIPFVL